MSTQNIDASIAALATLIDQITGIVPSWVEGLIGFSTVADLIIDTDLTGDLADGRHVKILEQGGFLLTKVSSGVVHYTAASGAMFRVVEEPTSPMYFQAAGDGSTNDKAALDKANATPGTLIDLRGRSYLYSGTFTSTKQIINGVITDNAGTQDYRALAQLTKASAADHLATPPSSKLATVSGVATMITSALAGQLQSVGGRLELVDSIGGTGFGQSWVRRDFDDEAENTIVGASWVNNQAILPAGAYHVFATGEFYDTSAHNARIRLRDVVNNVTLRESSDQRSIEFSAVHPFISSYIVLAAQTTIEFQYFMSTGLANTGLGISESTTPRRRAVLEFVRVR